MHSRYHIACHNLARSILHGVAQVAEEVGIERIEFELPTFGLNAPVMIPVDFRPTLLRIHFHIYESLPDKCRCRVRRAGTQHGNWSWASVHAPYLESLVYTLPESPEAMLLVMRLLESANELLHLAAEFVSESRPDHINRWMTCALDRVEPMIKLAIAGLPC